MGTLTVYARGDSSTANNASVNAEGTNTTPTAKLTFSATSGGDMVLDPNGGLSDPDTMLSVNGGPLTTFTVEFAGTLPNSHKLSNVNGYDLRGEEIVVITDDSTGQRYFFLTDSSMFLTEAEWQAVMDAFPNGAHAVAVTNTTNPIIICFASGTAIDTPTGRRLIEELAEGDLVLTLDNGPQPIRWIGRRSLVPTLHQQPILFEPGTIGNDRVLRVSPQHRMLVGGYRAQLYFGEDEVLVAAKALLNGQTIRRQQVRSVTYHHILFDRHEIVFSDGAASESYHPGRYSLPGIDLAARRELLDRFPELKRDPDAFGPSARPAIRAAQGLLLAA